MKRPVRFGEEAGKMQEANRFGSTLANAFAESYIEKLFYFCLKKTGSHTEAEDLTQDIALQILTALRGGTVPTSFPAWVWQIARNRYAVWAKEKHHRSESVTGSDVGDYELEDECETVLDEMIRAEQTALLRRELAFIKSDYRSIVVAYYIDGSSVRNIAASLSLPENTVKSKLFRAREILKEGMEMAREFGKRSYKPEDISFAASGSQPSGLPWTAVERKIPKNILLQASNNPSTPEELSMELGIALPYMEEEIALLHRATLLEKQGEKYITNFFIMDGDCLTEVYHTLRDNAEERSRLIRELLCDIEPDIRALGIAGDHIDNNAIRFWAVPAIIDRLIEDIVRGKNIYDPPRRANGESWGFVGYERIDLPEDTVMGHNGSGNEQNMFWTYKYSSYSLWDQCGEPGYEAVMLLCDCIRNRRLCTSFSEIEKTVWAQIDGRYAHSAADGTIIPDLLVMTGDSLETIHRMFREHRNYGHLLANTTAAYEKVEEIFKRYSHRVLHDNLGYNVRMELYAMRMMAVHDLVDGGVLTLPEDPGKSTLGMHLILR